MVGLLHDIAYDISPASHGKAAWAILGPYAAERDGWMLAHHQEFQSFHCPGHPDVDVDERERWRGHPHFEYTADFVARYDQTTICADAPCLPLETFVPMVRRFFARPARPVTRCPWPPRRCRPPPTRTRPTFRPSPTAGSG